MSVDMSVDMPASVIRYVSRCQYSCQQLSADVSRCQ